MAIFHLAADTDTAIDVFSPDLPPVLTVAAGDSVVVHTLNAAGHLERQQTPGGQPPRLIDPSRGHCLVGPIAVAGAQPGDVLAVEVISLRPDPWGLTVAGTADTPLNHRLGLLGPDSSPTALLWELDPDAGTGGNQLGLSVDLAPFLGVMGVAPAEAGEHSTVPPRPVGGGNIDCRELVAGSTLYLPIAVPGALLSVGDGHAAQGDGEVSGTAIECGMTSELRFDLISDAPVDGIHAVTPAGRITFGFNADLNEAMTVALEAMLIWMGRLYGLTKGEALTMASVAVSLRITQVANRTWGVHALLPHGAIRTSS